MLAQVIKILLIQKFVSHENNKYKVINRKTLVLETLSI